MNRYDMHMLACRARPLDESRIDSARARIADALTVADRPYVAFSGGKDSAVLLDLALQIRPDLPVIWLVNYPAPGHIDHLKGVGQHHAIQIQRALVTEWANAEWRSEYGSDLVFPPGLRIDATYGTLREMIAALNVDGVFMGMRASEGTHRRMMFAQRGHIYHAQYDGIYHVSPIYDWPTADVWRYCATHKLPMHPVYRALIESGTPAEKARVDGMDNVRWLSQGLYAQYRRLWPADWAEFTRHNPIAETR